MEILDEEPDLPAGSISATLDDDDDIQQASSQWNFKCYAPINGVPHHHLHGALWPQGWDTVYKLQQQQPPKKNKKQAQTNKNIPSYTQVE